MIQTDEVYYSLTPTHIRDTRVKCSVYTCTECTSRIVLRKSIARKESTIRSEIISSSIFRYIVSLGIGHFQTHRVQGSLSLARARATGNDWFPSATTYQPFRGLYQGSVHSVHLVIESARVAQIMPGAVSPPKRRRYSPAVDALATLAKLKVHRRV